MNYITLKNKTESGDTLEATFLPDIGMNLISFKRGQTEVIDPSTKEQFEERRSGLGPLIGPHFHRRRPDVLPVIKDESAFPHIARVKAKGIHDPFSHGIARYAPWQAKSTDTKVSATLSGKSVWNGVSLAELEGQNFQMEFSCELKPNGLHIGLSVVSDSDSLVGIHYYYHLPNGFGTVVSRIQNKVIENNEKKPIPDSWNMDTQQNLTMPLNRSLDVTLYPFPDLLGGRILLDAGLYQLQTSYRSNSQENCWQLYHPEGASYVCIEPISAQDPRHPNLTVSSLQIQLEIQPSGRQ